MIGCIDMNSDSSQSRFESFLGSTVEHLRTDTGGIRVPRDENELTCRASVVSFELKIDQTVAAIIFRQILTKVFVRLGSFTLLFNDDSFLVLDHENKIAEFVISSLKLEFIKGEGDVL